MSVKRYGLQTTRTLWPLIKEYHIKARRRKEEGRPVCWHLSGIPRELFLAMDIVAIFCEGFTAQMSAKGGAAMPYLLLAEAFGYGRDS
jgi:hypothetical protein